MKRTWYLTWTNVITVIPRILLPLLRSFPFLPPLGIMPMSINRSHFPDDFAVESVTILNHIPDQGALDVWALFETFVRPDIHSEYEFAPLQV